MSNTRAALRLAPLVLRQLARSPRRTALTFLGLVIAFFLFTSLESLLYTMNQVVEGTSRDALLFVRAADRSGHFGPPRVPSRYADSVETLPGVLAAAPVRFHFGQGQREGSFAVAMGIEPDAHLKMGVPQGVTGEELRALFSERDAALVGQRMLEDNGWAVGDEVTIRNRRGAGLSFTIRGDIAEGDRLERVAVVRLDYLEDGLGSAGRVTFVQVRVKEASLAPSVAEAIDLRFANATVPTETITEKAHVAPFIASLSDAMNGLRLVGYLALVVTLLVVGNSVAIGVRERTREIGTLRAVGFGSGRVMGLVLSEAVVVAVAGGGLGALAAWAVFASGGVEIPGMGFGFTTDASVVLRAALLSVPLGALAGAQPAWSAVRRPITEALRYSE